MSQAPDFQSKQSYRDAGTGAFVWQSVAVLIGIEIAFAAGLFLNASFGFQQLQGEITIVLATMATLCLGFGIGILVSWRNRASDADALRSRYESLHYRADLLVERAERLERKEGRH